MSKYRMVSRLRHGDRTLQVVQTYSPAECTVWTYAVWEDTRRRLWSEVSAVSTLADADEQRLRHMEYIRALLDGTAEPSPEQRRIKDPLISAMAEAFRRIEERKKTLEEARKEATLMRHESGRLVSVPTRRTHYGHE